MTVYIVLEFFQWIRRQEEEEEEEAEGLLKCLARAIGRIVSAPNGRDVKEKKSEGERTPAPCASTDKTKETKP